LNAGLLLRHLLREFASSGRMILFSSHVLEVVEKVCSQVVILYKGRVAAQDSIAHLRDLLQLPSLEDVFSQLTAQHDYLGQAKRIVQVMGQQ
jgi:ABC-2 type transport system ATP-binding protein